MRAAPGRAAAACARDIWCARALAAVTRQRRGARPRSARTRAVLRAEPAAPPPSRGGCSSAAPACWLAKCAWLCSSWRARSRCSRPPPRGERRAEGTGARRRLSKVGAADAARRRRRRAPSLLGASRAVEQEGHERRRGGRGRRAAAATAEFVAWRKGSCTVRHFVVSPLRPPARPFPALLESAGARIGHERHARPPRFLRLAPRRWAPRAARRLRRQVLAAWARACCAYASAGSDSSSSSSRSRSPLRCP